MVLQRVKSFAWFLCLSFSVDWETRHVVCSAESFSVFLSLKKLDKFKASGLLRCLPSQHSSATMHRTVLLTSTSLSLHKTGSIGMVHTSPSRKHFLKRFTILFHMIKDLFTSAISSTICETGIFTICSSSPGFPTHTTHTKFQQLKHRLCVLFNHLVLVMDPFREVTLRIRVNRIA